MFPALDHRRAETIRGADARADRCSDRSARDRTYAGSCTCRYTNPGDITLHRALADGRAFVSDSTDIVALYRHHFDQHAVEIAPAVSARDNAIERELKLCRTFDP